MATDRLDKDKFDEMLGRSLRGYKEPVPGDFTVRMLERVKEAQQQRALAKVIMQERIALAACIGAAVFSILGAVAFPGVGSSLIERISGFMGQIDQAVEEVRVQWQFLVVIVGVVGIAVYNFVGLLTGDGS